MTKRYPDQATLAMASALEAVLSEVTPGIRPHSIDSHLPAHIVQQAREAYELHLATLAAINEKDSA